MKNWDNNFFLTLFKMEIEMTENRNHTTLIQVDGCGMRSEAIYPWTMETKERIVVIKILVRRSVKNYPRINCIQMKVHSIFVYPCFVSTQLPKKEAHSNRLYSVTPGGCLWDVNNACLSFLHLYFTENLQLYPWIRQKDLSFCLFLFQSINCLLPSMLFLFCYRYCAL